MSIADTEPAMRMVTIEFSKSNGEQSKFHVLQEQAFLCGLFRSMLEADISDEKEEAQAIPLCESDMSLETFQIVRVVTPIVQTHTVCCCKQTFPQSQLGLIELIGRCYIRFVYKQPV